MKRRCKICGLEWLSNDPWMAFVSIDGVVFCSPCWRKDQRAIEERERQDKEARR